MAVVGWFATGTARFPCLLLFKKREGGKMYVRICSSSTFFVLSHGHSVHASVILFWNLVRGVNTRDLRGD